MPRVVKDECIYIHQTWTKLLINSFKNDDYTIAEFPARARDSDSLNSVTLFSEAIEFCNPSIVIVELGIVDCAPRIITKKEHALFNSQYFPKKLKEFIIKFRKTRKNKILRQGVLKKVYVNPSRFVKNFNYFINKTKSFNSNVKIIIIPILGYKPFLETKSNGYTSNINLYNDLLLEISKEQNCNLLIDLTSSISKEECFTSDGYHLSQYGHLLLSLEIKKIIGSI